MIFLLKDVFDAAVNYLQVMDENGAVDQSLFPKDLTDEKLVDMLRFMLFTRALDAKTLSLQRQGRAATYAPSIGEEATQVGSAMAMKPGDLFVPNFRQHGVYLVRGLPLDIFFLYWKGYEEGGAIPKEVGGFPYIVPVSSQLPHGAGIAFAQKYMKTGNATLAYVGDGGTSEGNFYEAMNFAGAKSLPLVIIIENNQWAISVPRSAQTASKTLAQKGIAAGIKTLQVDGNDVVAVYKATRDALNDAYNGIPSVLECVTYRMSMHTTADDPTKYRDSAEVEEWKRKDPIDRLRKYLASKQLWDDKKESDAAEEFKKAIDEAVDKAEKFTPDPESMFTNVYSYMPETLQQELDDARENGFYMTKKE
ncbi:MAG: pyruvate dehydrogenase (acetyl-transferring) E1 component subunit alpha [Candidatus Micrarchaeota archaeon]|nr:pyruvate dehydrogenase (acetyl-transferring) E1 component subunit alpha [Candidatus Micrarchaeota archaeon]